MTEHELPEGMIYQGNAFRVLPRLPRQSVQLVVTSPPYFGLRDYETGTWVGGNDPECDHKIPDSTKGNYPGSSRKQQSNLGSFGYRERSTCKRCGARRVDDQLGLEEEADCNGAFTGQMCLKCYVCHQVMVYRLVRDVLRDDGVFVLNIGDSYRNKNLQGIPWRLALALQADGWFLRSALPWVNRSKMPESTEDRPASGLEYVFIFTKQGDYYWDVEATKLGSLQPLGNSELTGQKKRAKLQSLERSKLGTNQGDSKRNLRNSDLWFQSIKPPHGLTGLDDEVVGLDVTQGEGYAGGHYASYPLTLVKPFILAATSQKGCCPRCGACWRRVTEKERTATRPGNSSKVRETNAKVLAKRKLNAKVLAKRKLNSTPGKSPTSSATTLGSVIGNRDPQRHVTLTKTVGWQPGCTCEAGAPVPCTVLDPFGGVMTTCLAAQRLGRRFAAVELSEEYVTAGLKRLRSRGKASGTVVKENKNGLFSMLKGG